MTQVAFRFSEGNMFYCYLPVQLEGENHSTGYPAYINYKSLHVDFRFQHKRKRKQTFKRI